MKVSEALENIYGQLSEVPCEGCGECCVSPTCTGIEFALALRYLLDRFPREEAARLLLKPPEPHPSYDGNLRCCLQDVKTRRCLVHPARTLACRLFGLPVISTFHIDNLENCRKIDFARCGKADAEDVRGWLTELTRLNGEVAPYYCEPFWIGGLNIECWLAVYFDPLLDQGAFGELKKYLHDELDLSFLEGEYRDRTGLKDKVDRITLLYQFLEMGDRDSAMQLVQDIRTGYPLTGTYYLNELAKIEALLRPPVTDTKMG